jgi:hypothetical protein
MVLDILSLPIVPLFVDIEPTNPTWSGIQIFIRAPNCKIDVPVMQGKRHVSDGVGQVPTTYTALEPTSFSQKGCITEDMFTCSLAARVMEAIGNHCPV